MTRDRRPTPDKDVIALTVPSIEFGNALNWAMTIRYTKPLADYVASHLLNKEESLQLAAYIRSLQKPRRGRPPARIKRPSNDQRVAQQEKARIDLQDAIALVRHRQRDWRRKNGRQRVWPEVTEGYINEAVGLYKKVDLNELRKRVDKSDRHITADKRK